MGVNLRVKRIFLRLKSLWGNQSRTDLVRIKALNSANFFELLVPSLTGQTASSHWHDRRNISQDKRNLFRVDLRPNDKSTWFLIRQCEGLSEFQIGGGALPTRWIQRDLTIRSLHCRAPAISWACWSRLVNRYNHGAPIWSQLAGALEMPLKSRTYFSEQC